MLEPNEIFQLINNKQIGFLKGSRTAGHLLVLNTIINKVVNKHRQKLFVASVDLKKACHKIDRQALIFKLDFSADHADIASEQISCPPKTLDISTQTSSAICFPRFLLLKTGETGEHQQQQQSEITHYLER